MSLADFNARQRAQKKADQERRNQTRAMMNSFKSGNVVSERDLAVSKIKKEQKLKEQEAAKYNQSSLSRGGQGLSVYELKLQEMKKQQKEAEKKTAKKAAKKTAKKAASKDED